MFYHIIWFMIVVSVFYYCLYLDLLTVVAYFIKQYDTGINRRSCLQPMRRATLGLSQPVIAGTPNNQ